MASDTGPRRAPEPPSGRDFAGKRDYVRSLEQRRDPEALALLVACLGDESGYLRDLAENALLRVGAPAAAPVMPLLGQGLWFSRASAARLLGSMGHAPAASSLLRLAADPVENVVREAYASLATLARGGGAARVAWELHRLPPETRQSHLARMQHVDRAMAERLVRLLRVEGLMAASDPDSLRDDAPSVRATEEESAWEGTRPAPDAPDTTGGPGPSSR